MNAIIVSNDDFDPDEEDMALLVKRFTRFLGKRNPYLGLLERKFITLKAQNRLRLMKT